MPETKGTMGCRDLRQEEKVTGSARVMPFSRWCGGEEESRKQRFLTKILWRRY